MKAQASQGPFDADRSRLGRARWFDRRNPNALVFGRVTFEAMDSWWPTPGAAKSMPEVAKGMNEAPKYVFSRTLDQVNWGNTGRVYLAYEKKAK